MMTSTRNFVALIVLLALLTGGCVGLYTGTITMVTVERSAMDAWADLAIAGQTTPAIDAKVTLAHETFRASCVVAADALRAYKASGDPSQYNVAVEAARRAAQGVLDILIPILTPKETSSLQGKLNKATTVQ